MQRESQHVQTHATQQATSVAQDSAAKQVAIEQAAAAHSTAVNAAGASQTQRVHTVLGAQAARMGQRGAAAGGYGGSEKGHAEGVVAQEVASKGQAAIQKPGPVIAGDVKQTASHASQKIVATGKGVASRLHAGLPAIQRRIQGLAQKTAAGLRKMEQRAVQQLTATHGTVMAGLQRKEGEAHSALQRQTRTVRAALGAAAARHRRDLGDATRAAAGKVRTETAALARAAERGHEAQPVASALEQAKNLVGAHIGGFIERMKHGVAGFGERASQKSAEVQQHLAQGTQAAQSQAHQITTQSHTASQQLNAQGLAHAAQGAGQATQGIGHEVAQAHTRHQQVAQEATTHVAQAATHTTEKLGAMVDQTTARNESHVAGQVDASMTSAAAMVGADHDKSLLDKVVDFFEGAWDWLSSVAKAVAGIVIDFFVYATGAILQMVSNLLGGLLDPLLDRIDSDTFQRGRDFGDTVLTFLTGVLLIIGGIAALGGGAALSFVEIAGSGGLLIPVVIVQDGVLVTVGVGAIAEGILMMSKASKQSGKERGSDIPSWAKGSKMEPGETPSQAADRVMRQRFPDGNYDRGPRSEFNKIKKFFERSR